MYTVTKPIEVSTVTLSFTHSVPCSVKRLKDRKKGDKFSEVDEREEPEDKDKPIKIIRDDTDKLDSNKLLSPDLPNISSRSGASSPSPSDGMYAVMLPLFGAYNCLAT